jgi:dolichol kinase
MELAENVGWHGLLVLFAIPVATLAYWRVARPDVSLASAAISASAAALLAAVAESLPVRLTDNLRVGVAAAVGMIGVHVAFLGWS